MTSVDKQIPPPGEACPLTRPPAWEVFPNLFLQVFATFTTDWKSGGFETMDNYLWEVKTFTCQH